MYLSRGVSDGSGFFFNAGLDSTYRIDGESLDLALGPSLCDAFGTLKTQWSGDGECSLQVRFDPEYDARTGRLFVFSNRGNHGSGGQYRLWSFPSGQDFFHGPTWNRTVKQSTAFVYTAYDNVYVTDGTQLRAFDAFNGNERWQFENAMDQYTVLGTFQDSLFVVATSAQVPTQLYSFRFYDRSNPVRWARAIDGDMTSVHFAPAGLVLVFGSTQVTAYDYASGRRNWTLEGPAQQGCSGVSVVNGMFFATCGFQPRFFAGFDVFTGQEIMRYGGLSQSFGAAYVRGTEFTLSTPNRQMAIGNYTSSAGTAVVTRVILAQKYTEEDIPPPLPPFVPPSRETSEPLIPKQDVHIGIIVAGSVAGVAVVGGALVLLFRKPSGPKASAVSASDDVTPVSARAPSALRAAKKSGKHAGSSGVSQPLLGGPNSSPSYAVNGPYDAADSNGVGADSAGDADEDESADLDGREEDSYDAPTNSDGVHECDASEADGGTSSTPQFEAPPARPNRESQLAVDDPEAAELGFTPLSDDDDDDE
jgi:hypothetical protein